MSFSTEAEVSIVLEDRSVRAARQNLESNLGTVSTGVTDGGTVGAQAAGGAGGGRARRRARREHRWARERTDYAEQQAVYLEEIEDHLADGALGGGGGLLGTIIGQTGDAAGEAGGAAALTGAASALTGSAAALTGSAGAHTGAAAALVGAAAALGTAGGSVDVEKPGWIPLKVKDPGSVEVERPGWMPLEVEDVGALPVDDPSPLGVDDPSPLEVEDVNPIPVDAPESIPVSLHITGVEGGGQSTSESGGRSNGLIDRALTAAAMPIAQTARGLSAFTPLDDDTAADVSSFMTGAASTIAGGPAPAVIGGTLASGFANEAGNDSTPSRRPSRSSTPTIETVTYDNNVKVIVDVDADVHYDELDRLEDDIMSQTETRVSDAIRDLEQDILRRVSRR